MLVEGFRPGVMRRLGLDYQHLRALNPRIVYVALTGYGQSGKYSQMAGHDINYLALAGVLSEIGTAEPPVVPGAQLADLAGGSRQAVIGTLLALHVRERTGVGRFVNISMMAWRGGAAGDSAERARSHWRGARARRFVVDGPLRLLRRLSRGGGVRGCRRARAQVLAGAVRGPGHPEWTADQFAEGPRRNELKGLLANRFLEKSAEAWFAELRGNDCSPVRDVAAAPALKDPAASRLSAAPALGEPTVAVLREFMPPGDQ